MHPEPPPPRDFDNPFCTRRVQPGALPYRFVASDTLDDVLARLRAQAWRGAIVGPHGSGKSTLLAALLLRLEAEPPTPARRVYRVNLHDGQRSIPKGTFPAERLDRQALVVIDGYEQLSGWARLRLGWRVRRADCGLLVTAHRPVRLAEVFRTATTAALAQTLVESLLRDEPSGFCPSPEQIASLLRSEHGDLRETLFALYDLYEAHKQALRGEAAAVLGADGSGPPSDRTPVRRE
ncbi:MAG TPA: hypothetical protein VFE24_01560 [Pirellulales bacterium]|jgi:energy-coupling factor transporter ATP-binding protein EcfA2|nr:hypothetical protein [Pirellulales bacterium]